MAFKQPTSYVEDSDCIFGLTKNGILFLISKEDVDLLNTAWTFDETSGYVKRNVSLGARGKARTEYLHKLIGERLEISRDLEVDHRNCVKLDNRRSNLRGATSSQQKINRRKPEFGNLGVFFDRRAKSGNRAWRATFRRRCKYFHTEQEAIAQRRAWEDEFWAN
jgi:hypothetical protein